MANIDERLLAAQLADQQRQARLAEEDKKGQVDAGEADRGRQGEAGQADGQSGSLRERWRAAKRAMDIKQRAKDKLEEKSAAPGRKATGRALQWAWRSLFTVIGFIPGLIWINIHVLLKMIFGEKLFCKLGDEWLPAQADAAAGEAGKTLKRRSPRYHGKNN